MAYERSCDFLKERHSHARWQITFARPGCLLSVRTYNPAAAFRLNSTNASILPSGVEHDALGESAVYDTFTLYPTETYLFEIAKRRKISSRQISTAVGRGRIFKRSAWLDQLIEQYFVRRILSRNLSEPIAFLEAEICDEVIRLLVEEDATRNLKTQKLASAENTSPLVRALSYLEANLFSPVTIEVLAERSACSVSTLLRIFKKELKTTPMAYLRRRRMEEAKDLLTRTDKPIGEIAVLVGFNNQGAFTDAFRASFGTTPRTYRVQPTTY